MTATAASASTQLWVLRPGKPEDVHYVTKTWVGADGWLAASRTLGLTHRIFHTRMVGRILKDPTTALTIAAHSEDTDAILGWSCTAPGKLFYVYTRKELRRMGMGRALVAHLGDGAITYTHQPVVKGIPIPDAWVFNPYANHDDGA